MFKYSYLRLAAAVGLILSALPAPAQVATVDPNQAASYQSAPQQAASAEEAEYQPVDSGEQDGVAAPEAQSQAAATPDKPARMQPVQDSVEREDVFSAAEGVFGKGAEGLAGLLEKILKDQGEPVAYIAGREAGGAFIAGVRYGSGTMRHQVEGDRQVFWTGPSVGFDFGADANKVFVLVYNLHDAQKLFRRYPAAEGRAYAVGGFTASYLRRGDVVLIPVRLGVGLRLGVNAGYMRFSEANRWLPF
jgi:hypothetical protein